MNETFQPYSKSLTLYYLPNCSGCHTLLETKWKDYQKDFMGGLIHFKTIDLSKHEKPASEFTGGEITRVPTLVFRDENFFTKIKDPFEMSTQEKTLLEGGALEREIIANIIGGYERWKAEHAQPEQLEGGRRRHHRMRGGESTLKGGETVEAVEAEAPKDLTGGTVAETLEGGESQIKGGEAAMQGGGRRKKARTLSRKGVAYRCKRVTAKGRSSQRRSKSRSKSRSASRR